MQERAEGLEKVVATGDAQLLPPGTATGMAIGAEIAPAHPTTRGTVRVRAKVHRGVHLAAAPPGRHDAWGRGAGCLWAEVAGVLTGVTMRLGGEPRKGCALTMALWPWGCGLGCRRARGGVAWPRPMEHDAQPYQGDQHQLVEKEMGYHGKTPSYKCSNEDILPGFQTVGISRRLEVHDRTPARCPGCLSPRLSMP